MPEEREKRADLNIAEPEAREMLSKKIQTSAIKAGIMWTLPIVCLLLAAFLYVNHLSEQRATDRVNEEITNIKEQRAGCERQNKRLLPMYHFLGDAIDTRRQAAVSDTDPMQRRNDLKAVRRYTRDRQEMISAVADVAVRPGSPNVDCKKAYTLPTN